MEPRCWLPFLRQRNWDLSFLLFRSCRNCFTPCYIGVIGSLAKRAGVFHRLVEEYGIDERELDRIITPVGLNIKAETPAEIAISITGQMIQVRAERKAAMK